MKHPLNRLSTIVAAACIAAAAACEPANGQTLCGDRAEIVKSLLKSYREQPTAMGLASNGGMVEVLTSESGSWTLMMTLPTGQTCIMAAGEHWQTLPAIALGPDA